MYLATERHTRIVKETAKRLGFDFCGIAKADFLAEEAPRLESWLKKQQHGNMVYMENHFDKRLDPRLLVDDANTVVSLLFNYYPPERLPEGKEDIKISKYAYGTDYHFVVKQKLKELLEGLQEQIGEINGRIFVDSAPVMDKVWAKRSGIGWVGKHSNLINRQMGSFFFIAELITDLVLLPDHATPDYCGTCTRCIDACPTEAIVAPYVVDGSRCISYLTIELKDEIPQEFKHHMEHWAFGCDICQDVCPWNKFARPHQEPAFMLSAELKNISNNGWETFNENIFKDCFKNSPLKRANYQGIQKNLRFIAS